MEERLPVIKLEMQGMVTSFRYPHFTQGYQPTFEMPPPSTIYGHLCSAVGDYINPIGWQFGYSFSHEGKFVDYMEHLHFDDPVQPFPFNRELLFKPQLTLYITKLDLGSALHQPFYTVTLGRSQDLMRYIRIQQVDLIRHHEGYFENTLLPMDMAPRLGQRTVSVTMPRFINPRRQVQWGVYAMLLERAIWPRQTEPNLYAVFDEEEEESPLMMESDNTSVWIDPTSPDHPRISGLKRAVWLHSFVD